MAKDLQPIIDAIVEGEIEDTENAVEDALKSGTEIIRILNEGIAGAMNLVGEKWNAKEFFLPDVLGAVEAVKSATEIIKPHLKGDGKSSGTLVIGSVKGDLHCVGKNLVATFMEMNGFKVINLGEDVPAEKFIEAITTNNANIVGCSAFISTVAGEIKRLIALLKEKGLKDKVKVMIGGCALDPKWGELIGADAYTPDALSAVAKAKELLGTA
ncbi:MAG: cobalamin-dependent protein [Spirochaetaceae bacterium]|nr:cobalamin-dependent protein [Spirochaetaceae bacterium]